jgi:hypothetical protein
MLFFGLVEVIFWPFKREKQGLKMSCDEKNRGLKCPVTKTKAVMV